MLIRFISYLKGYVKITARGAFLERFLNLCLKNEIPLWDLKQKSESELSSKVSLRDFFQLRGAARRSRTRIKIDQKCGFPFFLKRHKARRGILIGAVFSAFLIWYFSTHLMGISISGSASSREEIVAALSSYGVRIGTPTRKIDVKLLKNNLMTASDDFGWVGVNLKGTRLFISTTARKEKQEASSDDPCNLVAKCDGVIRLMKIQDGQTMVLVNTAVKSGDLLVSGIIDSNVLGMRYAHASGEVLATTWYKEEIEIPLKYTKKSLTGKTKSKRTLNIFSLSLRLFLNENPPYKHYISREFNREYSLPLEIFPSVSVKNQRFYEQRQKTAKRSLSEATALGKFYLLNRITASLSPGAVIEKTTLKSEDIGGAVKVTLECECTENIALEVPIDKTDELGYN